ncbi:hypothetical protein GMLC_09670 [Geomonas limicola]|uniref:Hydrogenase maturation protease n=1 Tax=Geomonas limicola TaxID=2740186 RepID=A0A6V8N4B3_9BACT|nr:hydrogenase maturation protease [Geomonas limicola]GFO67388.1 hypothetical protein GMLC_09670 [Geomonas limicola]
MVVIGLGSPFLKDDAVGPRVVRELARRGRTGARLVESHAGGLLLLEELTGERQAVIVDALIDRARRPGELVFSGIAEATHNAACSHDCTLAEALALGRALGLELPGDDAIRVLGVVAADVASFGEELTPEVAAALPAACALVENCLDPGLTLGTLEGA